MKSRTLANKPLVEAIFEIRWELQQEAVKIDPHYKLLVGSLYQKLKHEYPIHESLPTAAMPDEIVAYIIQHRFRMTRDGWPLVQLGPGIITVNDTDAYRWDDFKSRIADVLDMLIAAYPTEDISFAQLVLRYIDAVDFDYETEDIFKFLRDKMHINVQLNPQLHNSSTVQQVPATLDLRFSFETVDPEGTINLRFARGQRENRDALIWETSVIIDKPVQRVSELVQLAEKAHDLTSDWFFKTIDGDLLRRFS